MDKSGRSCTAGTDEEGFVGSMVKTLTGVTVTRSVSLVVSTGADSSAEEMIPLRVFEISLMSRFFFRCLGFR